MRRVKACVAAALLAVSAGATGTDNGVMIAPFKITYTAETRHLTVGAAILSLTTESESQTTLTLTTRPAAYLRFSGKGRVTEIATLQGLTRPYTALGYQYTLHGTPRKSYTAQIDQQNNRVHIEQNGESKQLSYQSPLHDRLSMTLELMTLLATEPQFEQVDFNVLDGARIRPMSYHNAGTEIVSVPLGKLSAIRLNRIRSGSSRETRTWFAKIPGVEKKFPVPVKIEQYKNGKLTLRLIARQFKLLE